MKKHAAWGWVGPDQGADVIAQIFEPMPRQDFLGPTTDELRVLARHRLALDSSHVGKGLPKMTAIRTRGPQHPGVRGDGEARLCPWA